MPKNQMLKKLVASIFAAVMIISSFTFFTYDASAVTPTYYVSNSYKKSQFYKNLTAYKLTGDERYDVISIAMTQYGYHEGNDDNDMGGSNRDGYKNFAEYNRMYGKLDNGEGNGLSYGYSWCAAFVSWCLRQARVPKETVDTFVSCSRAVKGFRTEGIFKERNSGYVPLAGDIIFFIKPEHVASGYIASHVGFVVGCDGEFVYTIEGNTDLFKVCGKRYPLDSEKIVGYAVPEYKTVEGTAYDFPLRDDAKYPGMYEIEKNEIEIHRSINGTDDVMGTLHAGDRVKIILTDLGWGMVKVGDEAGWISLEYAESRDYELRLESAGASPEGQTLLKPRGEFLSLAEYIPNREGFTLIGWSREAGGTVEFLPQATYSYEEDAVLFAVWKPSEYTVSFVDWDGSVISSEAYAHGAEVAVPNAPARAADSEFTYEFAGWDAEITPALADAVYRAVYTAIQIPVTIPEETTDAQGEVTVEETVEETTEETVEVTLEETTREITDAAEESMTEAETTELPEIRDETASPKPTVGCASIVALPLLAFLPFGILTLRKKDN
jgi:hypothetical protein